MPKKDLKPKSYQKILESNAEGFSNDQLAELIGREYANISNLSNILNLGSDGQDWSYYNEEEDDDDTDSVKEAVELLYELITDSAKYVSKHAELHIYRCLGEGEARKHKSTISSIKTTVRDFWAGTMRALFSGSFYGLDYRTALKEPIVEAVMRFIYTGNKEQIDEGYCYLLNNIKKYDQTEKERLWK